MYYCKFIFGQLTIPNYITVQTVSVRAVIRQIIRQLYHLQLLFYHFMFHVLQFHVYGLLPPDTSSSITAYLCHKTLNSLTLHLNYIFGCFNLIFLAVNLSTSLNILPLSSIYEHSLRQFLVQFLGHSLLQFLVQFLGHQLGQFLVQYLGHSLVQFLVQFLGNSLGQFHVQYLGNSLGQFLVQFLGHSLGKLLVQYLGHSLGQPLVQNFGHSLGQSLVQFLEHSLGKDSFLYSSLDSPLYICSLDIPLDGPLFSSLNILLGIELDIPLYSRWDSPLVPWPFHQTFLVYVWTVLWIFLL